MSLHGFYIEDITDKKITYAGLDEGKIASFLTQSDIGKQLVEQMRCLSENPTGQAHTPTSQI